MNDNKEITASAMMQMVGRKLKRSVNVLYEDSTKQIVCFPENTNDGLFDLTAIIQTCTCDCDGIVKVQFAHRTGEYIWKPGYGLEQLMAEVDVFAENVKANKELLKLHTNMNEKLAA